jgi:nicotinamide riboside kinase
MKHKPLWIAVTGPESCGKTTLVQALCEHLPNAHSVLEYARVYLEHKNKTSADSADEVMYILQQQMHQLHALMQDPYSFIVSDTDDVCHKIWCQEVFGHSPNGWQQLAPDVTLLCAPDIPWEYDPLRSNPNDRDRLFDRYCSELNALNRSFGVVRGVGPQRFEEALAVLALHGITVQE